MAFSSRFSFLSVCACLGLTLFMTLAPGCTTRKQYAINEAILIGERRQLEDEIYRTQFELRDALVENERLRAELEGNGKGSKPKKNDVKASTPEPVRYPGGSALQVAPTADSNALGPYGTPEGEQIESLPDFVPVPVSRSKQKNATEAPVLSPSTRPLTTPGSTGGSKRGSSTKASTRASGVESSPYTFGQNGATRSNSPQIASSSYLSAPSSANKIGQTSYQGEKVQDESELEPWSPLAPY